MRLLRWSFWVILEIKIDHILYKIGWFGAIVFKYINNLPMINDRYINIFITLATFVSCALLWTLFIPKTRLWRHQDTNATHFMCSILLRLRGAPYSTTSMRNDTHKWHAKLNSRQIPFPGIFKGSSARNVRDMDWNILHQEFYLFRTTSRRILLMSILLKFGLKWNLRKRLFKPIWLIRTYNLSIKIITWPKCSHATSRQNIC